MSATAKKLREWERALASIHVQIQDAGLAGTPLASAVGVASYLAWIARQDAEDAERFPVEAG
jgi:hypothetical protein